MNSSLPISFCCQGCNKSLTKKKPGTYLGSPEPLTDLVFPGFFPISLAELLMLLEGHILFSQQERRIDCDPIFDPRSSLVRSHLLFHQYWTENTHSTQHCIHFRLRSRNMKAALFSLERENGPHVFVPIKIKRFPTCHLYNPSAREHTCTEKGSK